MCSRKTDVKHVFKISGLQKIFIYYFRLISGKNKEFHTEEKESKSDDYKTIDNLLSHADSLPLPEKGILKAGLL